MTENKEKKPFFVRAGYECDLLMSFVCFLTVASGLMMSLCYVQVISIPYPLQMLPAVMVPLFVLIRRLRIKNITMIIAHALAVVIFMTFFYEISGHNYGGTVYITISLVLNVIYSMVQRYTSKSIRVGNEGVIFSLVLHVFFFLLLVIVKRTDMLIYLTLNAVLLITCYFVARQLNVFEDKYFHNMHSRTQAVDDVRKQNHYTILIIVFGIIFSVVVMIFFPTSIITNILRKLIYGILWLLSKILPNGPKENEEDSFGDAMSMMDQETMDEGKSSLLVTVLANIALAILAILFFYLLITTLIAIFKRFRHADDVEKTRQSDAVVDIIESVDPKKKSSGAASSHDFGSGYEKEIRKKYYRTVKKAMKQGAAVKNSSSPGQIEDLIQQKGDPSISELTSLYESIRYNKKEN